MASKIDRFLSSYLHDPKQRPALIPHATRRFRLLDLWSISDGDRVLDIGCGQGESTIAFAVQVGSNDQVTGIENAPPDYGGPITIEESQTFIMDSPEGPRISFQCCGGMGGKSGKVENVVSRIQRCGSSTSESAVPFNVAVFLHSLWYFQDPDSILLIFRALESMSVPYIFIAEYAQCGSIMEQQPHLLAAHTQALLYQLKELRRAGMKEANIRAASLPDQIKQLAEQAG